MSNATTVDASIIAGGTDPAGGSRVYLVVREGERTQVIGLDDGADISFGRASESTVRLEDSKASREHARISRRPREKGGLLLVELGSRNGTLLNGENVRGESRALEPGDLVRIGAAEILVAATEGVAGSAGGTRLAAALARALADGGRATLLRLPIAAHELGALSTALAGASLVEAQPDGDYACLVADAAEATKLIAAVKALAPSVTVAVARAPEDGIDAAALWRRTAESNDRRALAPALNVPAGVVVGDPAMVRVFDLVRKVAPAPTTVLILGETGVGKEVIAEQIHRQSPRAAKPFVRLNCGSLPESLLESELFGHEKGAFTGADRRKQGYIEAADGGTLFLDEIGELALTMQTRLLRVLEDHKLMRVGGREEISADVRIVAATNRKLEDDVTAGRFRQDLYFRLSAFVVRVPPLRERSGELELLAELFARQFARRMNAPPPTIAPAAMSLLRRHAWPGNVRELRNAMEHAVVVAEGGDIGVEQLPETVGRSADAPAPAVSAGPMREQLADLERRRIVDALAAEGGNQTRAAKRLGISRRGLQYKLEKYKIIG